MSAKQAHTARRSTAAVATRKRVAAEPARVVANRGFGVLALACVAVGVTGSLHMQQTAAPVVAAPVPVPAAVSAVAKVAAAVPAVVAAATVAVPAAVAGAAAPAPRPAALFPTLGEAKASERYYAEVRAQLRWVQVRLGDRKVATPDAGSRLLLAHSAAELADLDEVGLDFRDVYGVINAETTWVPRTGMGRNGVASHGLAQFEPATARAVGLRNPHDAVEAVHAAAVLLKEAGAWSSRRIAGLNLPPEVHAQKLREGVSIYYNLSSRARRAWSGGNTHQLPVETLRHIRNVRVGAEQADSIYERLVAGQPPALVHASYVPAPQEEAPAAVAHAAERVQHASSTVPAHARAPLAKAKRTSPTVGAVRPVEVADRNGRKSWSLPQGSIAWSRNS